MYKLSRQWLVLRLIYVFYICLFMDAHLSHVEHYITHYSTTIHVVIQWIRVCRLCCLYGEKVVGHCREVCFHYTATNWKCTTKLLGQHLHYLLILLP